MSPPCWKVTLRWARPMYNAYAGATPRTMSWLQTLVSRYDPVVLDDAVRPVRVRVVAPDEGAWDVVLAQGQAMIRSSDGPRACPYHRRRRHMARDRRRTAWRDRCLPRRPPLRASQPACGSRLPRRYQRHRGPTRMRFRIVATRGARLSLVKQGRTAVLAVHGLGATKGSFLPTVAALSDRFTRSRSTSRASATPASRSALHMTRRSSPPRASTCSTRSSSIACT